MPLASCELIVFFCLLLCSSRAPETNKGYAHGQQQLQIHPQRVQDTTPGTESSSSATDVQRTSEETTKLKRRGDPTERSETGRNLPHSNTPQPEAALPSEARSQGEAGTPQLFPPGTPAREIDIWETHAFFYGYITPATQSVMDRFPQGEKERDDMYKKRVQIIRKNELMSTEKRDRAQNARKHGYSARIFKLAEGEIEQEYENLISDAFLRYYPTDSLEVVEMTSIVNSMWLLQRMQADLSELTCQEKIDYKAVDSITRALGATNRTLDKARTRLKELQQGKNTKRNLDDENAQNPLPPLDTFTHSQVILNGGRGQGEGGSTNAATYDPNRNREITKRTPLGTQSSSSSPDVQRTSEEITKRTPLGTQSSSSSPDVQRTSEEITKRTPLGTQSSSSSPDVQRTSEEITKRNQECASTFQPVPLEAVIAQHEATRTPFSLTQLFLAGYRYRDPRAEHYQSPYDTDHQQAA